LSLGMHYWAAFILFMATICFLLNDARWLVKHHEIPSVDHFSYTAQGQPWIYPFGGGLLFTGSG